MQSVNVIHNRDDLFPIFDFAVTAYFADLLANSLDSMKRNFRTSFSDVFNLAAIRCLI
jgi:hypothetical protein